ncbi:myosin light chain kinase, smooth muscle-like isoform X2 [Lineus longissimus]|uniref:myosin light chain kinase, smooth muscle-like isoform X2 n=1 Tax=Lineus longissimus TaxID=88925 RepID=UPI00315D2E04
MEQTPNSSTRDAKVKMSIRVDESEPDWDTIDIPFEKREVTIKKRWIDKEYDVKEFLGSGKFGEVKACVEKSTGKDFAAKFINTYTQDDKKGVMTEVEVMKKLQHPRLLQLYDVYDSSDKRKEMCLILELISGGELFERVVDDDFFLTERACMMFVKQIIDGVAHMHSVNVLHLDLKPENILCLTKKGNAIKIIDFGLAHFYDPKKKLMVLAGTPEFVAPEVVKYEGVSHATDMWSVGVICYVLLSGLSPFMGDSDMETLGNVTACDWSFDFKEFEEISDTAKDFISKLLVADPKKRMTSEESSKHSWLQSSTLMPAAKIDKARLKRFLIRRKWQKAVNAILALSRMGVHLSTRSAPGREN